MSLRHDLPRSFSFAINGIKIALKNEPNFRIHIIAAGVILLLALFLKFNFVEFAILTLTIGLVIILELINTTLEALVNLVSPQIQEQAKIAKDVAAAAVLLSAALAIIVGLSLFLPKFF